MALEGGNPRRELIMRAPVRPPSEPATWRPLRGGSRDDTRKSAAATFREKEPPATPHDDEPFAEEVGPRTPVYGGGAGVVGLSSSSAEDERARPMRGGRSGRRSHGHAGFEENRGERLVRDEGRRSTGGCVEERAPAREALQEGRRREEGQGRARSRHEHESLSEGMPEGLGGASTASCDVDNRDRVAALKRGEKDDLKGRVVSGSSDAPTNDDAFAAAMRDFPVPSGATDAPALPLPPPLAATPAMPGSATYIDPSAAATEAARLVRVAEMLQTGGRPKDALLVLERALVLTPGDLEATTKKGFAYQAMGALHEAYNTFTAVLLMNPTHVPALRAIGLLFQGHGLLNEAAEAFKRALAVQPGDAATKERLAATLTDLGTLVKHLGSPGDAIARYHEAIAVDSTYAPAFYNLGVVLSEVGRHDDALECYHSTVRLNPAHAEAHCNIGVLKKCRGDLTGAITAYEACLAVSPNHQLGRGNLSIALGDQATVVKDEGSLHDAIRMYERALVNNPSNAEAMYSLGVALAEAGEIHRAMIAYESALRLRPYCAEAWNNLGVLHREQNNVERAVECYQRAVAINPHFAQALNNIGVVYTVQGLAQAALDALQRATISAPTYGIAHNNLGVLLRDTGDIPEALDAYQECARHLPDHRNAEQNYLLGLNYIHPGECQMVCKAHATWGVRFQQLQGETLEPRRYMPTDLSAGEAYGKGDGNEEVEEDGEDEGDEETVAGEVTASKTGSQTQLSHGPRRLVVGYISPDLYTHSVSYFAAAPLSLHDPARVKLIVYSATPREDEQTKLLREAVDRIDGTWRDCAALSERQLAETVRADGVDVLVELTGHTANNRLGTMALRPAPVQVTWIGYPNSTGLTTVDYRITDAIADPEDTCQEFTEKLIRLPRCFLCYTPSVNAPPVAPTPCVASGFITFGCFNTLAKVTPIVRALWARLLKAVPNSRLLIKAKPFACQVVQQRFLNSMAALGVESWRIDLFPLAPATGHHLTMYGRVDIALDTFPYAGTTTTCEALYMGVPVVTMRGACHAHNVGASLLTAVGLEDQCVTDSEDEYIASAARLANPAVIAELRTGLRERMLNSVLCDGRSFVRNVEDTYVGLFRKWCEDQTREANADDAAASTAATEEGQELAAAKDASARRGTILSVGAAVQPEKAGSATGKAVKIVRKGGQGSEGRGGGIAREDRNDHSGSDGGSDYSTQEEEEDRSTYQRSED